jgi:hypothetical protein
MISMLGSGPCCHAVASSIRASKPFGNLSPDETQQMADLLAQWPELARELSIVHETMALRAAVLLPTALGASPGAARQRARRGSIVSVLSSIDCVAWSNARSMTVPRCPWRHYASAGGTDRRRDSFFGDHATMTQSTDFRPTRWSSS